MITILKPRKPKLPEEIYKLAHDYSYGHQLRYQRVGNEEVREKQKSFQRVA